MNRCGIGLVLVSLLLAGCDTSATPVDTYAAIDIEVGGESLTVWFGDDSDERRSGLMEVDELPPGIEGMLFTWDAPVTPTFTMENTPLPLDIWWFDPGGLLIGSYEMEPCVSGDCPDYRAPGQVKWALETPLGEFSFEPGELLSTVEND